MNVEGLEFVARAFEELVLELHPVEAQRVQETLEHIHKHQDCERHRTEHHEHYNELNPLACPTYLP